MIVILATCAAQPCPQVILVVQLAAHHVVYQIGSPTEAHNIKSTGGASRAGINRPPTRSHTCIPEIEKKRTNIQINIGRAHERSFNWNLSLGWANQCTNAPHAAPRINISPVCTAGGRNSQWLGSYLSKCIFVCCNARQCCEIKINKFCLIVTDLIAL